LKKINPFIALSEAVKEQFKNLGVVDIVDTKESVKIDQKL
jgi:hypothetical protein